MKFAFFRWRNYRLRKLIKKHIRVGVNKEYDMIIYTCDAEQEE